MRLAVVGGGIAGLAAAWEAVTAAPGTEVTIHDPGPLGGKLRTSDFAGRRVDEGADAFLARVPWGRRLCDELGIGDELVSPADGTAYLAIGTDLQRLPGGLVMGVPTSAEALAGSPVLSAESIARVAAEPGLAGAPLAADRDTSVGALVRARFGDEILERLVDPLVGGINAGDTDRLSVRASLPQIAEAATRSASLVEGLRAAGGPPTGRAAEGTGTLQIAAEATTDRPPGPVFWAHPRGMGHVVTVLEAALADRGVRHSHTAVESLDDLDADAVVVATPAPAAARLLGGDAGRVLAGIGHSSPVLLTLAFARSEVAHPLDASGCLVPRTEGRLVTAVSFATTKWAHLATDPTTVVLRASAGRYGDDRAIDADDDALLGPVLDDLRDLLGVAADPLEARITRWRDGFPQYEPGHLDRVAAVEADLLARLPHVRVAGAAYRGIGIPACIRSGREAAAALLTR